MLRECDDVSYFYNVYVENPTEENLRNIIRYRPQDRYDEINKKVILDIITGRQNASSKKCVKCKTSGVGLWKINKKYYCEECKKGVIINGKN